MHVVAENLRALLRLLTFDAEPMIDWDGVTFYKSDDHKPSQRASLYAAWLQREFGLAPVTDADRERPSVRGRRSSSTRRRRRGIPHPETSRLTCAALTKSFSLSPPTACVL